MPKKVVQVLIEGGKATPGPPLGPALGGLGLNMGQVVKEINEKTSNYVGMKVPVEIEVDTETKRFEVRVGTPPTSMLILRELKLEKGSSDAKKRLGSLKMDQVVKIAKMKLNDANTPSFKNIVKQVLGTALSMGVTVEGKDPREIQREVDLGVWDSLIGG
ncbi:MAG: 50S ribosomal protein L11 [Candidatus Korarchaeum sp.]|nr:50S ribosomal protein L11 [Candidatus Korarchaeum sp.]MDW8035308.1 50S ribosomal protein L11 [Candidatus Korarchaeum sp.]